MKRYPRRAICSIMIFLLSISLAACSGTTGGPSPSSDFMPELPVSSGEFTIAYLYPSNSGNYLDAQVKTATSYFEKLMREKGWNVKFLIEGIPFDEQTMKEDVPQAIRDDSTGGRLADAYLVSKSEARELLEAGLTQDLAKLLPDAAPAFYNRYRKLFGQSVASVPISFDHYPMGRPIVLYIRKDFPGKPDRTVYTVDDVFAILEKDEKIKLGVGGVQGFDCVSAIRDLWAGEQGYYPLDWGFYILPSDPLSSLTSVESIPGFNAFFDRMLPLYETKRLLDLSDNELMAKEETAGYIGAMGNMMDAQFLLSHDMSGQDYVAYALSGGFVPVLPSDEPRTLARGMAVSTGSKNAEQVIRFAQWVLLDPDNYRLVKYGAEGVDYRMESARMEFLNNGKAMTPEDWDMNKSKAYVLTNFTVFFNDYMEPDTLYAPDNYRELLAGVNSVTVPAWNYTEFDRIRQVVYTMVEQYDRMIMARGSLLAGRMPDGLSTESTSAEYLAKLREMQPEAKAFIEAIRARVNSSDMGNGQ